jgi:hypothetical protein
MLPFLLKKFPRAKAAATVHNAEKMVDNRKLPATNCSAGVLVWSADSLTASRREEFNAAYHAYRAHFLYTLNQTKDDAG